jgi:hypothetical protein
MKIASKGPPNSTDAQPKQPSQNPVAGTSNTTKIGSDERNQSKFEQSALPAEPQGPHVPLPQFGISGDPIQREIFPGDLTTGFVPGEGSQVAPYVRDARSPVRDTDYLRTYVTNLTKSLRDAFIPALNSGQLTVPLNESDTEQAYSGGWSRQALNYFGAIKAQHEILILGQTKEQANEAPAGGSTEHAYRGFWQGGVHDVVPGLNALFEQDTNPEGAYRFPLGFKWPGYGEPVTAGPLRIANVPEDAFPRVDVFGNDKLVQQVFHLSQKYKHMPLMLHRLAELHKQVYEAIESMPKIRSGGEPPSPALIIDLLSDYLHIASNTHLFERGNVSLFMSHVNYALERAGLNPIEHGGLDVTAMGKHFDEFRPIFRDAVKRDNPHAEL